MKKQRGIQTRADSETIRQLDKLLADEPEAEALMVLARERLTKAIRMTHDTTEKCLALNTKLAGTAPHQAD